MARVPIKNTVSVEQSGQQPVFSGVKATPEAFGAAEARAYARLGANIQSAGDDLDRLGQRLQEEETVRQVNAHTIDFDNAVADHLFGENGYMNARGDDAVNNAEAAREGLNKLVDQYSRNLSKSPDAQQRFLKYASSRLRTETFNMAKHKVAERRKSVIASAETRQGAAVQDAVENRADPTAVMAAVESGMNAVDLACDVDGCPPEVREAKRKQFESALHSRVIESFGSDYDTAAATAYFNTVKERIDPRLYDDIQQKINSFEIARSAEESRRRREATEARKQYERQTSNQLFNKLVASDLTAKDILDTDLSVEDKRKFLKMMQEGPAGPTRTNPDVFIELYSRINLPDGNPDKITNPNDLNQFLGAGLAFDDLKRLRGEFTDKNKPEVKATQDLRSNLLKTARKTLSGSNDLLGIKDPEGEAKYHAWLTWFMEQEQKARKDGASLADLYNPNRPDVYLGRTLDAYKRSDGDSLKSQLEALDSAPPSREEIENMPVLSPEEAAKLPSGTWFRGEDGKPRRRN